MGALDSKAFSGAAVVAALLFVVSAIAVIADDDGIGGDLTKYVLLIAGIVALIYSFTMFSKGTSYVRKAEGVLLIVTGLLFAVTCFMDTPGDFVAYDGILAFLTLLLALLAYWTAGTYGAMYVSAVLAAFEIAMSAYSLSDGYDDVYAAVIFVIFAVFLVVDAIVRPYIAKGSEAKTREVIEAPRAQKKEEAKAKRTKATPKAKKTQKKEEAKPVEQPAEKKAQAPAQPKPQPVQEEQRPAEAPAPAEDAEKKEQKRPDKATGEFMEKLMRSKDANAAVKEGVRSEGDAQQHKPVRTVKLPDTAALKAEKAKTAAVEEKPAEAPAPAAEPVQEEHSEEQAPEKKPAEPIVEAKPVMEEASDESVISEPIQAKEDDSEFRSVEPDWGHVVKDSSVPEKEKEPEAAPVPVEEEISESEPEQEIAPAPEEAVPEVQPVPAEGEVAPAPEESEIPAPAEEQEVAPAPVEDEIIGPEPEQEIAPAPEEESETQAAPESPAEEQEAAPAVSDSGSSGSEDDSEAPKADEPASEEEQEVGEDIYTDNSPEALVRRAAWNKGLRCRRNYGEHSIPVAFVKGKVAVYVSEPGADESVDEVLRSEGWTVLRFDAGKVTDGKAEGEQIAEAVKANVKTTKKRKARK